MVTLLNFQPSTGHYEKSKQRISESEFPNNRSNSAYYMLKVSAGMNEFFLRYEIPK
jgi:hypothetical protein